MACAAVCISLIGAVGTAANARGAASNWWKVDTHEHSAYSGDAKADIGIDAQLAKNYGYNAVFLTDHDRGTGFQINYANGNYQSFIDPPTSSWKTSGNSTWVAKPTTASGGASVPALVSPGRGGSGDMIHLAAASSAAKTVSSMIYTDRGPALNAGDVTLDFWMYPNQLTGAAGADVSVSLGGDVATGPKPIGYTDSTGTSWGLGTPKSTVLVWQVGTARTASQNGTTDVFVNQLHVPTLHIWNHYTVNVMTGATTWSDGGPTMPGTSTRSLNTLPQADQPDRRIVVLTYEKMEAVATQAGAVADVNFDDYVAKDTSPNCPAQEFADRDTLFLDPGVYNTSTFAMYPAREMGQNYHSNQFVFDPKVASDYKDQANDTPKIPEPYGDDAALCATSNAAASASAPVFAPNGIDNIPFVQQTGYPVQLNHPGITESVANAVAGNDHGADLVEVQTGADFSSPWDQVLATGHQIIGTYGSDAHRGVGPTAPSDFIYAPTFGRDDLLSALNQGLSFMALGNFKGHLAFNLDNGTAPYAARTPVMVPAGTTTRVYLNIDGGLPTGATVKWFSSSGTLDANKLAPQLGAIDPAASDGSYRNYRDVTLTGTFTYVRAAVYDSAGKLYANTQPIFFRPNGGGGGGGGGGGTLPPFTATQDTYVDSANPSSSYGKLTKLRLDNSPSTIQSYLRFTLNGVTGTVTDVKLKLYPTSSLAAGFTVNSVSDDSWTDAMTWNNHAAVGAALQTSGAVTLNTPVTITLPASTVTGNGDVNLALTPNSATALSIASREDTDPTHQPQLIVTTS